MAISKTPTQIQRNFRTHFNFCHVSGKVTLIGKVINQINKDIDIINTLFL